MAGRMELELGFGPKSKGGPTRDAPAGGPLRFLVIGDFSGREARGVRETGEALANRRLHKVDVDSLDRVVTAVGVRIKTSANGGAEDVVVSSLDDFHPDALIRKLSFFAPLFQTRGLLLNPKTAHEAAGAVSAILGLPAAPAPAVTTTTAEDQQRTIERLLGRPLTKSPESSSSPLDRILRDVVAPHVVPATQAARPDLAAKLDELISASMRDVLHDRSFQATEAVWRGLARFVGDAGPDHDLEVYLLDASPSEMKADAEGGLTNITAAATQSGVHWSVIVLAAPVGLADAACLTALGALTKQSGATLLAAAAADVLGVAPEGINDPSTWTRDDSSARQAWRVLRQSPQAASIGLVWPRILTRAPYGKRADRVESFAFEELAGPRTHDRYLWSSGAFAVAGLIATAFREQELKTLPQGNEEISDLPLATYDDEGTPAMQACAEGWLGERAVDAALSEGIMPLASARDRNAVRLVRVQSLAAPAAPLAAPWAD